MSEHFNTVSDKIVNSFRDLISDEARTAIGDEGFDQLSMLIEGHVTGEVLRHLESTADEVQVLADRIRGNAEHFTD